MFSADHTLGSNRWPVVKLAPGRKTEIVLLSTRFFAITTHWNGRSFPCCGDDCPVCELLPARGLFYLAVGCNSRLSMLELGSQSASDLEQHAKFCHRAMRVGDVYELSRKGAKSPVRSSFVREQAGAREVALLDLCRHVMALYKYPCPNPGEEIESYERRCVAVSRVRCERAAELLRNSRERQMSH